MSEFAVAPADAPKEQQFRIYDAARMAWSILCSDLEPEEVLAAIAAMAAFDIGANLFSPEDEEKALAYLRKTATELLPEVRRAIAEQQKPAGH